MAPINLTTVVHSKQKAIFNLVWNKYFSGPRATADKNALHHLKTLQLFCQERTLCIYKTLFIKLNFIKICAPTKVMLSIIAKTLDMQIMFQLLNAGDN